MSIYFNICYLFHLFWRELQSLLCLFISSNITCFPKWHPLIFHFTGNWTGGGSDDLFSYFRNLSFFWEQLHGALYEIIISSEAAFTHLSTILFVRNPSLWKKIKLLPCHRIDWIHFVTCSHFTIDWIGGLGGPSFSDEESQSDC